MKVSRFDSSEGCISKYVFELKDAIAESVIYKYNTYYDRTVICCSIQSGCPVGCGFCGTGKKFIRNLTSSEIVSQIDHVLKDLNLEDINDKCKKFQIMFMSMGEPMLNIDNVETAIRVLAYKYDNAELLISTVGIKDQYAYNTINALSIDYNQIGLQFSIHEAFDEKRDKLIPYKNKLTLREIRDFGISWNSITKRPVFLNYCITDDNISEEEINRLKDLFSPAVFNFTFSVICSSDETMKDAGYRKYDVIQSVMEKFIESGYNVRMFDPAGQDDIGGGCGQLWYVQNWLKNKK